MHSTEVNFDGLVGPTHNYAGLSEGNVASVNNANDVSSPKNAALQGLAKMKALSDMGLTQGVIAPQSRPDINILKQLGFSGSVADILQKAHKTSPTLLAACYSASSMWTANAATVSPSADTNNGKVHFTPANLTNKFHRSIEPNTTSNILKAMFSNDQYFEHHQHLPENDHMGDEGAANHTRLCQNHHEAGVEIFTYGRCAFNKAMPAPQKYPARQTLEASMSIARLHGLSDKKTVFVQQNPAVIDQGVFHNDVIAVGNKNVLFYHQQAFLNTHSFINELHDKFQGDKLHLIEVPTDRISVADAVNTYLFNTQLITLNNGDMAIIAPLHCQQNERVKSYLDELMQYNTPIKQVQYFDVNESMKNGGGPACLRLRVALNNNELSAVNQACILTDSLYNSLTAWVNKHYRDRLSAQDLVDPNLLAESQTALDELTQLLKLGSVYHFQQ